MIIFYHNLQNNPENFYELMAFNLDFLQIKMFSEKSKAHSLGNVPLYLSVILISSQFVVFFCVDVSLCNHLLTP